MSSGGDRPPTQAGKFKPRKPSKKKPTAVPIAAPDVIASSIRSSGSNDAGGRGRGRGRGSSSREGGRGRGRGRGRGGRGARVMPQGTVFFTGDATSNNNTGNPSGGAGTKSGGAVKRASPGIVQPGAGTGILRGGRRDAGQGEEIIIGEIEAGPEDGAPVNILLRKKKEFNGPSMFDDEEEENTDAFLTGPTYDSDTSSDEEETNAASASKKKSKRASSKKGAVKRETRGMLQPYQLPYDVPEPLLGPKSALPMYECQMDEKVLAERIAAQDDVKGDPPLRLPFLPLDAPLSQTIRESSAWMMFKFPTRLPHFDKNSTIQGCKAAAIVKGDPDGDDDEEEGEQNEESKQQQVIDVDSKGNDALLAQGGGCYDDTLKDISPGRFGRIIMYKSGKTLLVIGGGDGPEVRMQLNEGLQCSFYQQAVSIDVEQGNYIPLGEVRKTLVASPDIDGAFN